MCLCVAVLWALAGAGRVAAQEPGAPAEAPVGTELQIQQMRIQIMPEFDDPRVLVIVQGRLAAPAVDLSQPITFRLPRSAQINQMATMNMNTGGDLMHQVTGPHAMNYDRYLRELKRRFDPANASDGSCYIEPEPMPPDEMEAVMLGTKVPPVPEEKT